MNERAIIEDFLSRKSNVDRMIGLEVSKEVYEFIRSSSNAIMTPEGTFYNVMNGWYLIKIKD